MKRVISVILTFSLVLVGGCWDQLVIEDLAMALALGIDEDPKDPKTFFMTVTNPTFSDTAEENTEKYVARGYSVDSAFFSMQREQSRQLVLGQVTTIIFSEEAARQGLLHRVMQEIDQERDVNPNVNLLIVQGAAARDVLYLKPVGETRVAPYITDLVARNVDTGSMPQTTAADYWFRYATAGIAPVAPIIRITGDEEKGTGVIISGLAAFDSKGKLRGLLGDQEAVNYLFLSCGANRARLTTELKIAGKGRQISLFVKDVKKKVESEIVDGKVKIMIKVKTDVDIIDVDWPTDILEEDREPTIAKALARDLQGNAIKVLQKTQDWGTDIVGLGQYVRINHPKWFKNQNWERAYRDSEITLEVKVRVKRIGTLVRPRH